MTAANAKLKQENEELKKEVEALGAENKALKDKQSEMQERVGGDTRMRMHICRFTLCVSNFRTRTDEFYDHLYVTRLSTYRAFALT